MRLLILKSLRFSTLCYVLVELQHAHLFREKKVKYLIGMSIQKPSVCCTGGSHALRGLHRCGTEGVWNRQASSLSPGKQREHEASDQSGCSREPLCRWKVNHHCSTKLSFMTDGKRQTKARIDAVGLNADIVFGLLMLILYFSEYYL